MDNSKARAIATNNFQNLILSAPIDFKLGLIDFKLQTSILVQSICNNCAAFAIAANNFQKIPKRFDFSNTKLYKGQLRFSMDAGKKFRTSYSSAVFFPFLLSF